MNPLKPICATEPLKTQTGRRETSTIEHMLPEEAEPLDGSSRQRLADMLSAIVGRNTAYAELQAVPGGGQTDATDPSPDASIPPMELPAPWPNLGGVR